MTTWLPVEGFPNYVVSSDGDVANIKNYIPLATSKQVRDHTTYLRVTLFLEGQRHYKQVHRLVAKAFCKNPFGLPEVDHEDNNGCNNKSTNLEWVTRSQNIKRSFDRNPAEKLSICKLGGKLGGATNRATAVEKYKNLLGNRFEKFFPCNTLNEHAAVRYRCGCGVMRTATIMARELRTHKGKCPVCTNTVNRSQPSLE